MLGRHAGWWQLGEFEGNMGGEVVSEAEDQGWLRAVPSCTDGAPPV
jgi:hypothetical protein